MAQKIYINKLLSLSKAEADAPFQVQWQSLYQTEVQTAFLADSYRAEGSVYEGYPVLGVGNTFNALLASLLPTITRYPYVWALEGKKLDVLGYDFSFPALRVLEIEPVAATIAYLELQLSSPGEVVESYYVRPEIVSGQHLTKFSITLKQASPVSRFWIRLFATLPARLGSFVYESDLQGGHPPVSVNLSLVSLVQEEESILLSFGKPIFAKRMTFVLIQDSADGTVYQK